MKERPTVYVSNCLERLAESLGQELFRKGSNPFAKKIVLLPHHNIKNYLQSFFARNPRWEICMGVSFKTLGEGIRELVPIDDKLPSSLALSFAIEQELCKNPLFFGDTESEQKILWASTELSLLFYEYGMSEGESLRRWLEEEGWQQEVWKTVFCKQRKWAPLFSLLQSDKKEDVQVFLFGFSHLPSPVYDFFVENASGIYSLSPCAMFWEDLCSDRERVFLEKKMRNTRMSLQAQEQLSGYFADTHPLLANWGKMGRKLMRQLGEGEFHLQEEYVYPEKDCALAFLQRGILDLAIEETKAISSEDVSILCLSATSKLREMEVLIETLQELMSLSCITPKDVLVLCPDLTSYLPYIHTVFGSEMSPFSYSIHGIASYGEEEKGIRALFLLGESRIEREEVLNFLLVPSVQKKWGFSAGDIQLLRQWSERAHVLWGFDPEHKELLLRRQKSEGQHSSVILAGTWKEGMDRLLMGLVMDSQGAILEEAVQPFPLVESTEAELLGRFLCFLQKLKQDMQPLYEKHKKTTREWSLFVSCCLDGYFVSSKETDALKRDMESLQGELEGYDKEEPISFCSFKRALDHHLHQQKESFQSSHIEAIKFLPLEIGSSYPADVVCVIGCDEEAFPRKEKPSSLDTMKGRETPSLGEQSRYLFLEILLNARKTLLFSYERISTKDQKKRGPSPLIEELFRQLDAQVYIEESEENPSKHCMRHHPSIPFSFSYFQSGSKNKIFSPYLFSQSTAFYGKEREEIAPFFSSWRGGKEKETLKKPVKTVSISQLESFIKSPIRFYFQEVLQIFLPFQAPKDEEFFLSPLARAQILKKGKLSSIEEVLPLVQARGEMPSSFFSEMNCKEIQEPLQKWQQDRDSLGIREEDLYSIEFVMGMEQIEKTPGRILCPAPSFEGVFVHGTIGPVSSRGFLWFDRKGKEEYPLLWPSYLLFLSVAKELNWSSDCLLLGGGEKKVFPLQPEDPKLWLSKYIALYLQGQEEPCPVRLPWFSSFLAPTEEEVAKKLANTSFEKNFFMDSYESWILHREPVLLAEELYTRWHERWKDAFFLFSQDSQEEAPGGDG